MSEQKKQLLKSLAEAAEKMNEAALEKVVTFTAGVSAGAACAKYGEARSEETKHDGTEAKTQEPKPEPEPDEKEVGA